ncbi:dihydroorotase [Prosthecomicrobium pneumaticum]|uniref:Dihydroorotase n=1 Tax=Prosthecomicrobium pneumaticum TaxID=81895 RepID=A0A7W9CVZ4_9HYPH|nr:dihydroorotase [Prosthecomicrobium pneumaticum]MBB5752679.1 dihydroorotase [Prosthecomicrobium pneumaticum]
MDSLSRPIVFENARVVDPSRGLDAPGRVVVTDGVIKAAGPGATGTPDGAEIVDAAGRIVAPGLVDVRVFVGEPGADHRETFASAGQAAAAGGVTTIVTMPDTDPVIDDPALVDFIARRARDTAAVRVLPMAALTKHLAGREMTEIGLLREAGAVAFTDGRRSVANPQVMRRALTYARDFGALIVNQPTDADLVGAGVMNEGETAMRLGLPGIPKEAEIIVVERDVRLAALTGGRYHAAQISCAESLDVVRRAKKAGLAVTCGVSVAHLTLNERDIGPYRTFFRMTPPLRAEEDRQAMIDGVADGTIDVIVSSHDPQDVDTKRHPFAEAADGAVGLETLLAAALRLVHDGRTDFLTLFRALSTRPAELLGLPGGRLAPGAPADLVLIDPDMPWICAAEGLRSRSKNTPFEGARFSGRVLRTLVAGRTVYRYAQS